ncbi:MAG: class I tRNA ligase family protein [Candidatus Marinimicrobia bacterium]|nr:class I tRNA ligase family protein [Candidatus Neomarinimicrobiota bacterium]
MDSNEQEKKILEFWKKNEIFKKSIEKEAPKGDFVFYEGPPTANGKPGIHHIEARAFKDLIPRFKTMNGFCVQRKAGWDTHGLPVELEVEKKLNLQGKKDVESYGMEGFNKKCKESVWEYKDEWEKMTERIGYWVDMRDPYVTYENNYIETLWWVIKTINDKGLLYKGYKVVPNCPRCGTALSSHEVAQGYQNVEEESVYVKFKVKGKDNEYILAWTTTPWTLPGNVALAINSKTIYGKFKVQNSKSETNSNNQSSKFKNDEIYILAKDRADEVLKEHDYEIVEEMKGKDLVGLEYEPLFDGVVKETDENFENAFKVYSADFVSTEDGTGVVHIAVMYGSDDYDVGERVGLPKVHTVNLDGTFNNLVSKWEGKFVKDVEKEIIEELKSKDVLYKTEKYKHDYPFCWRCSTPLIYYAKDSWYFAMSKLRDELVKNNNEVNWVPAHTKEGRFGEWIRGAIDWSISRERYWGTPIPVWECEKCEEVKVVGSVDEIRDELGSPNKLFLVRHAEACHNVDRILDSKMDSKCPLTEKGEKQAEDLARSLKDNKIDLIFSSPLLRTRQTAEILSKKLGVEVVVDERLRELGAGELEGKTIEEFHNLFPTQELRAQKADYGVETGEQIRERLDNFLDELNNKYKNKNVVIVSHGDPLQILYGIAQGLSLEETFKTWYPIKGKSKQVFSKVFDLHRPYIDEVKIKCKCGGAMKRIPEVMDCWFDSGSMPFAQAHYPFENKEAVDSGVIYPADFICEAVDQTRGWFYTLLAVATLLGKEAPYKNVISLGHVLDKKGKKMSKSKGNVVKPMEMIEKYSADALRWYMYTINQPGDPKKFDEKDLKISRRVFTTFFNVVTFYKMFTDGSGSTKSQSKDLSKNVLDRWIVGKFNLLIKEVTTSLEGYDVTSSARKIEDFVNDLSQWYVRRSRDRFKSDNKEDKEMAQKTLGNVLFNLSKLMAPFAPFAGEHVYQELGLGDKESVHLESWPELEEGLIDGKLLAEMSRVREVVSLALETRAENKIKVRQPLSKLTVFNLPLKSEFVSLIKEEVNVKDVEFEKRDGGQVSVELDTEITDELKEEGMLREFVRFVQGLRKSGGLTQDQKVSLVVETDDKGKGFVRNIEKTIIDSTNLSSVDFGDVSGDSEVEISDMKLKLEIR